MTYVTFRKQTTGPLASQGDLLELLPIDHPNAIRAEQPFRVQVLAKGAPLAGGEIKVYDDATEGHDATITLASNNVFGEDLSAVDVSADADGAIGAIDLAVDAVSTNRATLGATQNRLDHVIANLSVAVENLSASESRVRDADMAEEMVTFTRNQIMVQAGTAMLAQANQVPATVLSLLQ